MTINGKMIQSIEKMAEEIQTYLPDSEEGMRLTLELGSLVEHLAECWMEDKERVKKVDHRKNPGRKGAKQ